jgi:hypothetical protein
MEPSNKKHNAMEQINEPQNVENEIIEHQTHGYNDNASK